MRAIRSQRDRTGLNRQVRSVTGFARFMTTRDARRWALSSRAELPLACGERVTFFACAKKGNQRNTPPTARLPGILPSRSARVLRGSPDVRLCTFSERAHIVCALLRTFPAHPRRASGGPGLGGILPQKPEQERKPRPSTSTRRGSAGMHGFVDPGAVRGAEHRSFCGISPKGRGDGSPRSRSGTGTVPSERPRKSEKRRNTPRRTKRRGAPRPAPSLFGYFLGNAKK